MGIIMLTITSHLNGSKRSHLLVVIGRFRSIFEGSLIVVIIMTEATVAKVYYICITTDVKQERSGD